MTTCILAVLPEQIAALPEITAELDPVLTVILMLLDEAGEPAAHVALLVKITVTASLFTKVVVVNVALLAPVFTPFTLH